MAGRKRTLVSKQALTKTGVHTLNVGHLFSEMVEDLRQLKDRLDAVGTSDEDPTPLLERVLKILLSFAENDERCQDGMPLLGHETRMEALRMIVDIRMQVQQMEARQRLESAKLAAEHAKSMNQVFLETRKMEIQGRMAEVNGSDDFSRSELERIARNG